MTGKIKTAQQLTKEDIGVLAAARAACRAAKAQGHTITCPFLNVDVDAAKVDICDICHAWMGTNRKNYEHPCQYYYDRDKVIEIFWREVGE